MTSCSVRTCIRLCTWSGFLKFQVAETEAFGKTAFGRQRVNITACMCVYTGNQGFVARPFCLTLSGVAFVRVALFPKQPRINSRPNQVSSASLKSSNRASIHVRMHERTVYSPATLWMGGFIWEFLVF